MFRFGRTYVEFTPGVSVLITSFCAMLGSTAAASALAPAAADKQTPTKPTPGAPPAFGTAPPVGPEVSPATFAEVEKLVQVPMTEQDRMQAAQSWRNSMAALYERRTGPRKVDLGSTRGPILFT